MILITYFVDIEKYYSWGRETVRLYLNQYFLYLYNTIFKRFKFIVSYLYQIPIIYDGLT